MSIKVNGHQLTLSDNNNHERLLQHRFDTKDDFIENLPIPLHSVNRSGIIIWANEAEIKLLGFERHEFIGKHFSNFYADKQSSEEIIDKLIKRENIINHPVDLICKNGKIKHALLNSNVYWEDNKFIHTRGILTDLSQLYHDNRDKHEMINKLQLTNTQFSELFEKVTMELHDHAILQLDKDGTVVSWNSGAERIKGYTREEILGQNFRIFYLPQDRQRLLPEMLLNEAITHGRAVHEGLRVRKNGTTFFGRIIINALFDHENNHIGFCKVTRDLSMQT